MYNFESLTNRKKFIENLGLFVNANFDTDYNVFVFGSFLTDDFRPEKSDLDLAIYTKGDMMDLDMLIQEFVATSNIKLDLIWIHPEFNNNYIDLAPLQGYYLTNYYPEELQKHFTKLIFSLQREMEYRTNNYLLLKNALERSMTDG